MSDTPPPTLFETPGLRVRELRAEEVPGLQALFDANPGYFVKVGGQPPGPDEAQREFDEQPPAHLNPGHRWFAGVFDRQGALQGLVILVADLAARGVWHTALFFLAEAQRGTGAAQALHAALQGFAQRGGAQWLRLAVIDGNQRAQRFWPRMGYQAVRTRPMVNDSGQAKTSIVMVKPLTGGTLADYWHLVPRDHPESTLP